MNRVLSFPQSHSCDDPAEVVSKRFCFSCLFSVSFLSLIGGYLLGYRRNDVRFVPINRNIQYSYVDVFSHFDRDIPIWLTNNSDYNDAPSLYEYFNAFSFDEFSRIGPYNITLTFKNESLPDYLAVIEANGREKYRKLQNITAIFHRPTSGNTETWSIVNIALGLPVYANFGTREDFQYLIEHEISLRDCIAILRLGKISIHDKVTEALKWGIKGILFFADSQQYPKNCSASNREISPALFANLLEESGGPTNSGCSQNCGIAIQIIEQDVVEHVFKDMIPTKDIPVLWRGSLNVSYNIGPGFVSSQWRLVMRTNLANIHYTASDLVGYLKSPIDPDRYLIVAHSRRSSGSQTNSNSMKIFTRVAKSLAKLKNDGWKPSRTIVFCSFDSTDIENNFQKSWLNEHSHNLAQRAVAFLYIPQSVDEKKQVDIIVTKSLRKFFANVLSTIKNSPEIDSKMSESLLSELQDGNRNEMYECSENTPKEATEAGYNRKQLYDTSITLKVPVLSFNYQIENIDFGDNSSSNDDSVARLWTLLAFSLANDLILPFDVASFTTILQKSEEIVWKLSKQYSHLSGDVDSFNHYVRNAVDSLAKFHREIEMFDVNESTKRRILNDKLMQLEKLLNCVETITSELGTLSQIELVNLKKIKGNALGRGILCARQIDDVLK